MADYIDRDAVYDAILIDGGLNAYGKAYCLDIVKKFQPPMLHRSGLGGW